MKLQKEELAAVASHIYEKIKEKNKVVATKEELKSISAFLKKREEITKQIKELQDKQTQLQKETFTKLGVGANFYYYDSVNLKKEVERLKAKEIPSLNEIRQAIVMKSLFSNETELKKFIEELISKY